MEISTEQSADVLQGFQMVEEFLPGIKIIVNFSTKENLFICKEGQNRYGVSQMYFRHLSPNEFKKLIFDVDDEFTCQIDTASQIDRERPSQKTFIRQKNVEGAIQVEVVIERLIHVEKEILRFLHIIPIELGISLPKSTRILNEMIFMKKNQEKYNQLSKRNKEVLALMVKGYSAVEIGNCLFIGTNTVNTHKRRIKEILEIKSTYELMQYGLSFNLI